MTVRAVDLLHSWNVGWAACDEIVVEEDTRDALQSVSVIRPPLRVRAELLELSDQVGIDLAFVGFPAASQDETEQCAALVGHVAQRGLRIRPVLMARAVEADLQRIVGIQQGAGRSILADIYISISQLRITIEGWVLPELLERLRRVCLIAVREGIDFRIAFEDSTRARPNDLIDATTAALDLGPACIVLNDTAGDCLPSGAAHHTEFVREIVQRSGATTPIAWHGHNDKGLALANALASIGSGASVVSGTILGVGERTGNIPLEQLLLVLADAGAERFNLLQLEHLCRQFADAVGIQIPNSAPLVGSDAFSTATGTHAAAIVKARLLGGDFEDLVYSGVSARRLGRTQTLLVGPNSGRASVRAALEAAGLPPTDAYVTTILDHCKTRGDCIRTADALRHLVSQGQVTRTRADQSPD